jgi:anti-sigma factor RsiW
MTTNAVSPVRTVDDGLLDRLVDGELAAGERAAVLSALDAEPDGWRRCAVALLEAQAWRGALQGEPRLNAVDAPAADATVRPMRIARRGGVAAGLAAAFVVAFLTGFLARGGSGNQSASETSGHSPFAARTTQTSPPLPTTRPTPTPARPLELVTGSTGAESRVRLPLLTAGADSDTLRQPSALPEYVRRQLERQGYQVEGDQQVVSVALEDGRSVAVPVERLKYRYVGYRVH